MDQKCFTLIVFSFILTNRIVSQDVANVNMEMRHYYFAEDHRETHKVFLGELIGPAL